MNRKIKFRFWDIDSNSMKYPYSLHMNHDGSNGVILSDGSGYGYCETVMQYTGLKDINGVEIYEGDIIGNMIVSYCGDVNDSLGMNCGWYLQRNNFEVWIELECNTDHEIIGNIHQNQKLIK